MSFDKNKDILALGCDHAGYAMMQRLKEELAGQGVKTVCFGSQNGERYDYPLAASAVAEEITSGRAKLGILVCGTGIGMSIAANKINGIRAAACSEKFGAEYSRLHNNANILCLGARVIDETLALEMARLFLNTDFEGGRHQTRVDMITELETK